MSHNFSILTFAYFMTTSVFIFAMEFTMPAALKNSNSIVLIEKSTLALGTDTGFYFFGPLTTTKHLVEKLHDYPTKNLITNHNKQLIGTCCSDYFFVYDSATKKKIWSHKIPLNENYSATFGPNDTIFVCIKGQLTSNKHNPISLFFADPNSPFPIACHPKEEKILYSSGKALSLQSLTSKKITRYMGKIDNEPILSALWSPYSPHTALFTEKKIFVYSHKTNKMSEIKLTPCNSLCCGAVFLPDSSILALLCSLTSVHFCDFEQEKTIFRTLEYSSTEIKKPFSKKIFDFSSSYKKYVVFIDNKWIIDDTPTPIKRIQRNNRLKNRLIKNYWLLQQYSRENSDFILREIIQMLAHYLIALTGVE